MKTTITRLAAATALAVLTSGCFTFERKSTTTSPSDIQSLSALLGNWSSSSALPGVDSCSDFKWNVTEQTGSSAAGTFSATCPGGLTLAGTAQGTLLGNSVTWTATGNATAQALLSCAFTLNGTAYLESSQIRVPYTGQTCLGAVKGEEILQKH